jgi:hypothetical protein
LYVKELLDKFIPSKEVLFEGTLKRSEFNPGQGPHESRADTTAGIISHTHDLRRGLKYFGSASAKDQPPPQGTAQGQIKVKLIRIAKSRKIRNLIEATYQSVGKTYWFSPKILHSGDADKKFQEKLSLSNLLVMSESIQEDVGELLGQADAKEVPSIGISAEITLASEEERNEFSRDLLKALETVIQKYEKSPGKGNSYTMNLMCYPKIKNQGQKT